MPSASAWEERGQAAPQAEAAYFTEDSAKRLTRGKNGMGYEQRKTALRNYLQGWVEYFDYADMGSKVKDIDQWLRRRLRMCI